MCLCDTIASAFTRQSTSAYSSSLNSLKEPISFHMCLLSFYFSHNIIVVFLPCVLFSRRIVGKDLFFLFLAMLCQTAISFFVFFMLYEDVSRLHRVCFFRPCPSCLRPDTKISCYLCKIRPNAGTFFMCRMQWRWRATAYAVSKIRDAGLRASGSQIISFCCLFRNDFRLLNRGIHTQ